MKRLLTLALGLTLAALGTARAQSDFPSKPVTIVVPFTAGGPSDTVVRILADELMKVWNQPVLVDNRPGGGTVIGMNHVRESAPDGYTLAQVAGAYTISPAVRQLPYDTLEAFRGITVLATGPHAVVASPKFAPNTMAELLEESKKRQLTFSSSGLGSGNHMAAELVASVIGAKWQHVPYNGDAEAMSDLLSGLIDFSFITWANVRSHVDAGNLKLIAFNYDKRIPGYDSTPTIMETYPDLASKPFGFWIGIVGPKAIPDDVLAKIDEGMKKAITSESFTKRISEIGSIPGYKTSAETDEFIRNEMKVWADLVKDQNIVIAK